MKGPPFLFLIVKEFLVGLVLMLGMSLPSTSMSSDLADKAHLEHAEASSVISSSSYNSADTSSLEEVLKYLPLCTGYKWVDKDVREYFSKYKWSSSVHRFDKAYLVLDKDSLDDVVFLD